MNEIIEYAADSLSSFSPSLPDKLMKHLHQRPLFNPRYIVARNTEFFGNLPLRFFLL